MSKVMSKKLYDDWNKYPDFVYKGKNVGTYTEKELDVKVDRLIKVKVNYRVELYGGKNRGADVVLWREHSDKFTKNPKYYLQSPDGKYYGIQGNFWNYADALEKYECMVNKDMISTFIEQCYD